MGDTVTFQGGAQATVVAINSIPFVGPTFRLSNGRRLNWHQIGTNQMAPPVLA